MKRNSKLQLIVVILLIAAAFSLNAQNLLINADAETGDLQGWVDADDAWSAASTITPHSGSYFFWPSRLDIPYTELYQNVDVTAYSAAIDAGSAYFNLAGWLSNWDQYPHDRATLAIEALNGSNEQLMYLSRDHRSPVWTKYQIEGQIPPGTRVLSIKLIATRFVGADNDGYFDDLSLEVNTTAPTTFVIVAAESDIKEIPVDGTLQLSAETFGDSDTGYLWASSFDAVATVDSNGLVTTHSSGKVTIQATGKNSTKTGYIELTAYNPEDIIFITPQTDEQWLAGSIREISWHVKGSITSGTLFYSTTGGSSWIEIATTDSLSSEHFFWTVPDSAEALNSCYIKMTWNGGESVSSAFTIMPAITAIIDSQHRNTPKVFQLLPNFPNPFNPSTNISYQLSITCNVKLVIYNSFGQVMKVLVNEQQGPGIYQFNFNANDLASGVYFYHLQVGPFAQTRKMMLIQ